MINESNILTMGFRGRIGNLVFRRWGTKTVVSSAPDTSHIRWSKAQKENRERFRDAMAWAKTAMSDPEMRKYYSKMAKGMQTAWNVAVADYMKKPEVTEIDVCHYKGQKGNTVRVKARDNYRVVAVLVAITDAQGFEVESGPAGKMQNGSDWIYKATRTNLNWQQGRIVVRVSDSPGNVVTTFRAVQG